MTIIDRAIVRALPAVPRQVVKRLSSRYIAGTTLAEACDVVRELNSQGKEATLDVLGEEVTLREEAIGLRDAYRRALDTIEEEGLRSNVSVKLTALGLKLDRGLCRADLTAVVEEAARFGNFVRIDMEDSSTTSETLALYRELREGGHDNLGVVLQAALKRTLSDIGALADLRPNVRVCKGIYVEPAEIAYQEDEIIRLNFLDALEALFDTGSYVGIATHDDWLIGEALALVERRGLGEGRLRVPDAPRRPARARRRARPRRASAAYLRPVRPRAGTSTRIRRLQENPKIAGYVALDTLKRLRP